MNTSQPLNTPKKRRASPGGPLTSFMKLEIIPVLLYMLGNIFFVYIGIKFVMALFFENVTSRLTAAGKDVLSWTIFLVLFMIVFLIAISPAGEAFLRWRFKCKAINNEDISKRVMPLFYEVYSRAKAVRTFCSCSGYTPNIREMWYK